MCYVDKENLYNMVTENFKLTKKELFDSLVEVSKSRWVVRIQRATGIFLFLIMMFLTIINVFNHNFVFSFGYLFPLILSLCMIFIAEITAAIQVPDLLKKKDRFTENMQVEVDEENVSITGESFNSQMSLGKLHSVIETNNFFLLKVSEGSANIIPKRVLSLENIVKLRSAFFNVKGLKVNLKKAAGDEMDL